MEFEKLSVQKFSKTYSLIISSVVFHKMKYSSFPEKYCSSCDPEPHSSYFPETQRPKLALTPPALQCPSRFPGDHVFFKGSLPW